MKKKHTRNHGYVFLWALLTLLFSGSPSSAISLDAITELAREHDAQLRADTFAAEARNADGWQAVAEFGPTLTASGTYAHSRDSSQPEKSAELEDRVANFEEGEFTIGLKQPLIDLEKASIARKGLNEREISKLQLKKASEELLLRVHNRYYGVLTAQENHKVALLESGSLHQQLDRAKQRLELGFGTITDQYYAEARYSLSLAAKIASKTELDNSLKALEEIINQKLVEEVDNLTPDITLPQVTHDAPHWLEVAYLNNTDLGTKQLQYKSAHLHYQATQSRFLPTLVFYADYNERHPDGGLLGYEEERSEFDVGLRLEINLLAGGKDSAATVAASKREKAARELVTVAKRSVNRSVHSLWDSIYNTNKLIQAYRQATDAHQRAMESTQASYDEGAKALLDVLNAQQDYFRSLRKYKTTRHDYMVLQEKFRQVVGVDEVIETTEGYQFNVPPRDNSELNRDFLARQYQENGGGKVSIRSLVLSDG